MNIQERQLQELTWAHERLAKERTELHGLEREFLDQGRWLRLSVPLDELAGPPHDNVVRSLAFQQQSNST